MRVGPSWQIGKTATAYSLVYALLYLSSWLVVYYLQKSLEIYFGVNSFPLFLLIIAGFVIGFDLTRSIRRWLSLKELNKLALICAAFTFLFLAIFREAIGASTILGYIEQYWANRGLVGHDFPFRDIGQELVLISPLHLSPLGFAIRSIVGIFLWLISGAGVEIQAFLG